jgi:Ni/Co efflux regulator RcnB
MKRLLVLAAVASLVLPGLAIAQDNERSNPPRAGEPSKPAGGGQSRPSQPSRPANPSPPRVANPARPQAPRAATPARPQAPRAANPARPQPSRAASPQRRAPRFAQPLPPRGNQFSHRGQYYNRISGPAFVYPSGWRYRAWAIGALFPALFLTPAYFYDGYAALGLEAPPPEYVWVRFGPDLVLVDTNNREVEDVVYGVFQ